MRIVHINDKLELSGGVEVYLDSVVPLLREAGLDVEWVSMKLLGGDVTVLSKDGTMDWRGKVADLRASPLATMNTLFHVHSLSEPSVLEALFELGPVVRKAGEPRMVCPGQGKFWARSEEACTIPFGLHCFYHAYTQRCCNRRPKRLFKAYANARFETRIASGKYAKVLANSDYTRNLLLESGFPESRVALLHNFAEVVEDPGPPSNPNEIVFAGRLARSKGVHYLLEAFLIVLDELPDSRLTILGDGIDREQFHARACRLKLSENVEFTGWADRSGINAAMRRSSLVAFPSIYPEAFGIVGIEAMMRGRPVVAFDVGGVRDWLRHEETGLLVPVKDTRAFADGVVRLLKDERLRSQMGHRAREVAMAEFSEEVHLRKLMRVYEEALSEGPRRSFAAVD